MASRQRIIAGSAIATSLDPDFFPRLVIRMVSVGESSGRLPEVLERVSTVYEDQAEASITMATSLFEPIIICVFGTLILTLVLAIYMPVFTVASSVG
ncbi:MAG: type II secretion system F family protein [bacterium]